MQANLQIAPDRCGVRAMTIAGLQNHFGSRQGASICGKSSNKLPESNCLLSASNDLHVSPEQELLV